MSTTRTTTSLLLDNIKTGAPEALVSKLQQRHETLAVAVLGERGGNLATVGVTNDNCK